MTRSARWLWSILLLSVGLQHAGAQSRLFQDSTVRSLLRRAVDRGHTPGIVVGILEPDGSKRYFAHGTSGRSGLPLDEHTEFEIGSITKVFTATLLADMISRGEVRGDDPIAKYLPGTSKTPSRGGRQIRLMDLVTHHSGLPREATNFRPGQRSPAASYGGYSVDSLYDFLSTYTLPRDPGAKYEYSNVGMGLLGHLMARRSAMPFEQLMKARILDPLGMHETAITPTPEMERRLARGYSDFGDTATSWTWTSEALMGAGSLHSTASDMLRFAEANFSNRTVSPYPALRETHRPRLEVDLTEMRAPLIGMMWVIGQPRYALPEPGRNRTITWHNGGTAGYRTYLGLDLEARRAVVVLTNGGGVGSDDVGFALLDSAMALRPTPAGIAVAHAIRDGGLDAGLARYRALRSAGGRDVTFDVDQLDNVGYWLLNTRKEPRSALTVFEANIQEYPNNAGTYDSRGDAYRGLGDTAKAIESYRRALQLDSTYNLSRTKLRQLGVTVPETAGSTPRR